MGQFTVFRNPDGGGYLLDLQAESTATLQPAWGTVADFPRMLMKILAFGLLVPPRLRYLRAAFAGVLDGLGGLGGPARKSF